MWVGGKGVSLQQQGFVKRRVFHYWTTSLREDYAEAILKEMGVVVCLLSFSLCGEYRVPEQTTIVKEKKNVLVLSSILHNNEAELQFAMVRYSYILLKIRHKNKVIKLH